MSVKYFRKAAAFVLAMALACCALVGCAESKVGETGGQNPQSSITQQDKQDKANKAEADKDKTDKDKANKAEADKSKTDKSKTNKSKAKKSVQ